MTTGSMAIRVVRAVAGTPAEIKVGLLAWLTLEIAGLVRIDGTTLRRTRRGDLTLAFAERIDARGARHPIVCPVSESTRHHVERAVFQQLRHLVPTLVPEES